MKDLVAQGWHNKLGGWIFRWETNNVTFLLLLNVFDVISGHATPPASTQCKIEYA